MENFEKLSRNDGGAPAITPADLVRPAQKEALAKTRLYVCLLLFSALFSAFFYAFRLHLSSFFLTTGVLLVFFWIAATVLEKSAIGLFLQAEVKKLETAALLSLNRVNPASLSRAASQKAFADALRDARRKNAPAKKGVRLYSPAEKPDWKHIDYRRLVCYSGVRKNLFARWEGKLFLFAHAVISLLGAFGFYYLIHVVFAMVKIPARTLIEFAVGGLAFLCLFCLGVCSFEKSFASLFAYAFDCESASFYAVYDKTVFLSAFDRPGENVSANAGATRRRSRRGGKNRQGDAKKPAEAKAE